VSFVTKSYNPEVPAKNGGMWPVYKFPSSREDKGGVQNFKSNPRRKGCIFDLINKMREMRK
jgi:hypothetical protein